MQIVVWNPPFNDIAPAFGVQKIVLPCTSSPTPKGSKNLAVSLTFASHLYKIALDGKPSLFSFRIIPLPTSVRPSSSAFSFSGQKAIKVYKSQQLKDKAVEALIQYTEDYRMMVAYGEKPIPGKQPRGEDGHKVILYNAEDEKADNFSFNWNYT